MERLALYMDKVSGYAGLFGGKIGLISNGFKALFGSNFKSVEDDLEAFRADLKKTTDSITDFIELKDWQGDVTKIQETFAQALNKVILDSNMSPKDAMRLRLESAQAEYEAIEKALKIHIEDENAAYWRARTEREREEIASQRRIYVSELNFLQNNTAQSRVYWEDFIKWMGAEHKSEVQHMFNGMNAEQIKALDWMKGGYYDWVSDLVKKYEKEHGYAMGEVFGQLKKYIADANKLSIRIPLIIGSQDGKSVYESLTEADAALDAAYGKIQRLRTRQQELEAKGANLSGQTDDDIEYGKVLQEITNAQEDYNKANADGGHSRRESAAATKAQKQAESELQKVLKDEISLLDKTRSVYKSLTKEGISSTEALKIATSDYEETLNSINARLSKFGLKNLDLTKYVGVANPRAVMDMLQEQLNTLVRLGAAKPAEIKDLQVKLKDLQVDSVTFNHKTVVDSLNNELGKIKDEYELAVELDANPELGDMFADMFGIDTAELPHSIDDYMDRVWTNFNKLRAAYGDVWSFDIFKADSNTWEEWGKAIGVTGEALEALKKPYIDAQNVVKKWATDTINKTKQLEYDLADRNGKIAIKEKELADLRTRAQEEQNEQQKKLLDLQVKQQELALDELKAGLLEEIPEYAAVFNSIAEHSDYMTRRLIANLKKLYDYAKAHPNTDGTYTITGSDGKTAILSRKELDKAYEKLTKEERKAQAPFAKIKEAFTKGDDDAIDYAKGIELIGQELQKLGSIATEIGNIAEILGANDETKEIIGDVATSLNGLATTADGITKFMSGDYLGGTAGILSGVVSVIGAWADNSNKKIDKAVERSEMAIKQLELAYIDLEHAIDKAYGTGVVGAKRALAAAKELELAELERQLALEQSRKRKNRDNDKILDLQKRIKELRYEIVDSIREITDELLGSDVGSFAENLVSSMAQAFKQGEDYMKVFNEQFDNMIDNMIIKSIVSKVVAQRIESLWDSMDEMIKERSDKESDTYAKAIQERERLESMGFEGWANQLGGVNWRMMNKEGQDALRNAYDRLLATAQSAEDEAKMAYDAATQIADSDISELITQVNTIKPELAESLKNALGVYWQFGQDKTSELSALQQGIQGVTEDTAGAIEAYMNGVSQQVYLHSDLLTQIRDTIIGFNMDAQLGTMAEMLRQLQNSYLIMQSMQSMMQGWTTPAGNGIRVELLS